MERLIRHIEEAKARGVDVDAVFVDYESKLKKLEVQLFGLKASIIFTFISPFVLYGLKLYCAIHNVDMDLPEDAIMKFCLFNAGSMVTFGFGSSVHALIKEIKIGKKKDEKSTPAISGSNDTDKPTGGSGRS